MGFPAITKMAPLGQSSLAFFALKGRQFCLLGIHDLSNFLQVSDLDIGRFIPFQIILTSVREKKGFQGLNPILPSENEVNRAPIRPFTIVSKANSSPSSLCSVICFAFYQQNSGNEGIADFLVRLQLSQLLRASGSCCHDGHVHQGMFRLHGFELRK